MPKRIETRIQMLGAHWIVNEKPNENPHIPSKIGDKVFAYYPSEYNTGTVVAVHDDPINDPYAWSHLLEMIGDQTPDEYLLKPGESKEDYPNPGTNSEFAMQEIFDGQREYEEDVAKGIYMYDVKWDANGQIGDWMDGRKIWPISEEGSHQWFTPTGRFNI